MKKYILFITILVLFDVFLSLWVNADLLEKQERLAQLQERVVKLTAENDRLKREVAQLSSLNRIAKLASEMGLARDDQRLIVVSQDQFAMR